MRVHDSAGLINAILAGLVAITGSCNNVSLIGATIIGIVKSYYESELAKDRNETEARINVNS